MAVALYNIFIMPIQLFIELVFSVTNTIFNNPGFAIIFVSVAVQLLCFPLYKRADDIQTEDREKQKEMKPWLDHIKKTFKGDERFMMQQTYYRSVDYKPIYAVKGSISLLLQIPFFIAAYNFLSNLELLKKVSFLGIADLSQPDQLIHIGGITLNLLPVLMTFFNVISGIIYLRGLPLKDKIQTYGLAALFLVILYKSPSGLVFYWTLNNLFSLLKNVFLKLVKNPKRIIRAFMFAVGIVLSVYVIFFSGRAIYLKMLSVFISLVCIAPAIISMSKKHIKKEKCSRQLFNSDIKLINTFFYSSLAALFLLVACFVPIQTIKASPTEFISLHYSPYGLLFNTICVFCGILFVWVNIFYIFSSLKTRKIFSVIVSVLTLTGIINYACFGRNLGTISNCFVYDKYPEFPLKLIAANLLVVSAVAVAVIFGILKKPKIIKAANQIVTFSFVILAVLGLFSISETLANEGHPEKNRIINETSNEKIIKLNRNGKNVIVLMLDRAISGYMPFAIDDNPELEEMFDGFTYYPNTLSFGGSTNFASPALFGGYEYIPSEINKRANESLVSKQNEALTVLPKLFADNYFKVTVCDPPYANYRIEYDISIYEEYGNISAYKTIGQYSYSQKLKYSSLYEPAQKRSFIFFSIMRIIPVCLQNPLYQSGSYWGTKPFLFHLDSFLDSFSVLDNLKNITDFSEISKNTFLMMQNDTTHNPIVLQEPGYIISHSYGSPDFRVIEKNGVTLDVSDETKIMHYQTFALSMLKLGYWLDYLKKEGVYDNTRIIIVSDHGWKLNQFENMKLKNGIDVEAYNPLLLVKDFNSKGFTISDEFMTNADTPYLAVKGLLKNPTNPFTKRIISDKNKEDCDMVLTTSEKYNTVENNGNTFDTSDGEWWSVKDNIFDVNNWQKVEVN